MLTFSRTLAHAIGLYFHSDFHSDFHSCPFPRQLELTKASTLLRAPLVALKLARCCRGHQRIPRQMTSEMAAG